MTFVPGSVDFAIDNRPPGYRVLELMPDGSIATEVCWLETYAHTNELGTGHPATARVASRQKA